MKPTTSFSATPMRLTGQAAATQAQSKFAQALALHQNGQLSQALPLYEQVIELSPKHFDALHLAGVIALQLGQPQKSVDLLNKALKIERNNANAYNARGAAYVALGDVDQAMLNYGKAISLDPAFAKAYNNRGNAFLKLFKQEAALQDFDKAIALAPDYFSAHNNRGTALSELKRYEEAITSFEQAIVLSPDTLETHWNLGVCCLRLGQFERGWLESEWRLARPLDVGLLENYAGARWTGTESLEGKTILVCSEQGLGDTIQFSRYIPLVNALGGKVLLEVQPKLIPLLKNMGVTDFVAHGSELPSHDFHCPLLSLPMVFGTHAHNIPKPSDITTHDPEKVDRWRSRLGEKVKPRVGIVWSGNASHLDDFKRSIALEKFAPFLSDDIQWVSLHKDVRASDLPYLKARPDILHFGDEQGDFTDVAALCELMDVVVSVDTSLAHLAATMGKPTWILLSYNADWRWLTDRDDCPWYPSVTLFRQTEPGNWNDVLQRVKTKLLDQFHPS